MSNFREFDRETRFLLPPSLDEWLPEQHLARFVVEVIDGLDLSAMVKSYRGTGSAGYHPALVLGLLVYGYATGVFSSRKLERATYDSVAFRFIAVNQHPDHDTIATFRRRFLKDIEALFVRVLELAREMGLLKLGTVALDGTKIHANASRHSALSYEHATKIEAQLKAEVAELLARAEAADQAEVVDGMSIPEELARREDRLAKLAQARAKIEARATERFAREAAEHRAKLAAREAAAANGKKGGGRPPAPPVEGPQSKDQINLTDEDSRIMPVAGGGFDQCYNAQAVVTTASLLVIATAVVQAPNDKQQIAPMLEKIDALSEQFGRPETLLADNGYFSEANVMQCAAAKIEPLIATGRQPHHPSWRERFAAPLPAPENPTPVEAMAWRLRTPHGKQLYGLRKQTPEPVFGIIKSVIGFRQFLLRGLDRVRGEWSLVTMAWNIKRCMRSAWAERSPALRSNHGGGVQKSPRRRHVQSQQCSSARFPIRSAAVLTPAKNQAQVRQAASLIRAMPQSAHPAFRRLCEARARGFLVLLADRRGATDGCSLRSASRLRLSASIKLTTLAGRGASAGTIVSPACFLRSSSLSAVS